VSHLYEIPLIDELFHDTARQAMGEAYTRLLGYFHEDGIRAVAAIEHAMAMSSSSGMVAPAHKLKGEAAQLGAIRLSALAHAIERESRDCLEGQYEPDGVRTEVAMLRACFQQTVVELAARPLSDHPGALASAAAAHDSTREGLAVRPVALAKPVFGRRVRR
jgi:HPt (histidine-containing phosphotransfer) domain-containing protein